MHWAEFYSLCIKIIASELNCFRLYFIMWCNFRICLTDTSSKFAYLQLCIWRQCYRMSCSVPWRVESTLKNFEKDYFENDTTWLIRFSINEYLIFYTNYLSIVWATIRTPWFILELIISYGLHTFSKFSEVDRLNSLWN